MPKAFTHICKKVNISLFDDTLTIYIKSPIEEMEDHEITLAILKDTCNQLYSNLKQSDIDLMTHIQPFNPNHDNYHQDNFDRAQLHVHMKFSTTIDQAKLKIILCKLKLNQVISHVEMESILNSYSMANQISFNKNVAFGVIAGIAVATLGHFLFFRSSSLPLSNAAKNIAFSKTLLNH